MMTTVAFLGLGAIGRPMAKHLAQDPFSLTVWNRTGDKATRFAKEFGVKVASTAAEAVAGAKVVITCLPTSRDVESLLNGPDGILRAVEKGSIFVDCTSGDPATSKSIALRLAERGVDFLDAPVSGGTSGAEGGTLTVMVGGDADVLEKARPVLAAFSSRIVHCGATGSGDAVKAVNNALLAVHIWSAAEGLAALAKMGVSPGRALEVINASSGRSNTSENLIPQRVLTRAFPRTFRAALLDKDVAIAAEIAHLNRVPTPMLDLVSNLFRIARREVGEEADHVEVVKVLERWADVEIQ